jgi:hypothetical protein
VHDLFKRSQPELFANFRRLLGYSGGAEPRDAPSPPPASSAPAAEGGNFRDLDFSTMRRQGTSYRILPDTYAMPPCSGRGPLETLVLNDSWVSVATGTEDLNFKTMRKNQYEESIFRAEDERFELDTTIETNFATIQMLQPIAAEINSLTEQEKRRYKLPQPLTAMHQKSIRRLYGPQGSPVIELLQKCPAAAAGALLKRLQQKDEEWRALRLQCSKTWKEVYEKNYTKSLDHRSFYFKQGDKKNFSGKQMVIELKALTEEGGEGGEGGASSSAQNAQQSVGEGGGPSVVVDKLTLPFTLKHCSLSALHDDTLQLMIFAARLNFSVFEGEIEEKISTFWKHFVRKFFVCPDQPMEAAAAAEAAGDAMEEDATGPKTKPLLVVAAGMDEDLATRDARPPEQRWSMPLTYPKTSSQLFIGNSHFYIFSRLYHIILMRLDAARTMAAKADPAGAESAEAANGEKEASATNGIAAGAAGVGGASTEHATRASLIASIRSEAKGDLYLAFQTCLKQLVEGKMEASTYEDVLRTLLGTNAYLLFTLHKIVSQARPIPERSSRRVTRTHGAASHRNAPPSRQTTGRSSDPCACARSGVVALTVSNGLLCVARRRSSSCRCCWWRRRRRSCSSCTSTSGSATRLVPCPRRRTARTRGWSSRATTASGWSKCTRRARLRMRARRARAATCCSPSCPKRRRTTMMRSRWRMRRRRRRLTTSLSRRSRTCRPSCRRRARRCSRESCCVSRRCERRAGTRRCCARGSSAARRRARASCASSAAPRTSGSRTCSASPPSVRRAGRAAAERSAKS